jgi:hypothetical protein
MDDLPTETSARACPVVSIGILQAQIAEADWQYRRIYFHGGEPEAWYGHELGEEGQHNYYRPTFSQDWPSGGYGDNRDASYSD